MEIVSTSKWGQGKKIWHSLFGACVHRDPSSPIRRKPNQKVHAWEGVPTVDRAYSLTGYVLSFSLLFLLWRYGIWWDLRIYEWNNFFFFCINIITPLHILRLKNVAIPNYNEQTLLTFTYIKNRRTFALARAQSLVFKYTVAMCFGPSG